MKTKILLLLAVSIVNLFLCQVSPPEENTARSSYSEKNNISELVDLESGTGNFKFEIATLKSGDLIRDVSLNIHLGSVNHFNNLKNSYGVNASISFDGILRKTINHIDDSLRIRPQEIPFYSSNPNNFQDFLQNYFIDYEVHYDSQGHFQDNVQYIGSYWGNINYYSIFDMDWENDVYEINLDGNKNFFTYNNGIKFLYYNSDINVSKQPFLKLNYKDITYKYAKNGRNSIQVWGHNQLALRDIRSTSVYMPTEIIKGNKSIKINYIDGNDSYLCGSENKIYSFNDTHGFESYLTSVYGGNGTMVSSIYDDLYSSCIQFYANPTQSQQVSCHNYANNHPLVQQSVGSAIHQNDLENSKIECQSITDKIFNEIESDECKVKFNYQILDNQKVLKEILISKRNNNGIWTNNQKFEVSYYNYNGSFFIKSIDSYNFNNGNYILVNKKTISYYDYLVLSNNASSIKKNEKGILVSTSNNNFMQILKAGAVESIVDEFTQEKTQFIYGADFESFTPDMNINDVYGLNIKEIKSVDNITGQSIKMNYEYFDKNNYKPSNFKVTKAKAIAVGDHSLGKLLTRAESFGNKRENFGDQPLYGRIKQINSNNSYTIHYYHHPEYHLAFNSDVTIFESQLSKIENWTSNNTLISEELYSYEPLNYINDSPLENLGSKIVNGFKTKFYIQESFNSLYTSNPANPINSPTNSIHGPFTFMFVEVIPFYNIKKPALKLKEIRNYFDNGKIAIKKEFYNINSRNLIDDIKIVHEDENVTQNFYEYDAFRNVTKEKKCFNNNLIFLKQFYYDQGLLYETMEQNKVGIKNHMRFKYDGKNNLAEVFDQVTSKRLSYYYGYNYTKLILIAQDLPIENVSNLLHSSSDIGSSNYLIQNYNNLDLNKALLKAEKVLGLNMLVGYTYDNFGIKNKISNNMNLNETFVRDEKGNIIRKYIGQNLVQDIFNNYKGSSLTFGEYENISVYGKYEDYIIKSSPIFLQAKTENCN